MIVEKVLKSRSLCLIGNAAVGMIGFNIGFYGGLLLTFELAIDFLLAVLISVASILFASRLKRLST